MITTIDNAPIIKLIRRWRGVWSWYLLAAAMVWISADLSRFIATPSASDTSSIWPPLGIALAATWVFGRRWIGVYGLLIGVWFYWHGYSPVICALFVVEQSVEVLAMTELYRRYVRESDFLASLAGALKFYLFTTVVVLLPCAGLVALAYTNLGYFVQQPFIGVWMFQWLPEAMGVVLFAPTAQRFFAWWQNPVPLGIGRWSWLFLLLFVALLAASITQAALGKYNYARGLDYLFFPLLIAAALRGYTVAALCLLPPAAVCTLIGVYLGTWSTNSQAWNALGEALTFAGVLGIMTQLVLASSNERLGLIASLRESSRRDPLTGELNRRGLIEQAQSGEFAGAARSVCVVLALRNFAHSRELLPRLLVDAGECWVLRQMRTLLAEAPLSFALARLDKGLYCAIVTPANTGLLKTRFFELVRRVQDKTFYVSDWDYQLEPKIDAIPFEGCGCVDDVVTAACYHASDSSHTATEPIRFSADYSELLATERSDLKKLEQIKKALHNDGFKLFGQLIEPLGRFDARAKMEFLLRMRGPSGAWTSPGTFMTAANRFGYMIDLDRWVIRHAFAEIAARAELRERVAEFSINLSGASLDDNAIRDNIETELARSGLPASLFCFEITETETIADWDRAVRQIQHLKQLGFAIALDDFGTGLASFDYLNRFDFDYVKIDGSFIRTLDRDNGNREIVEAIVLVAQRRSIRTVAEYVENDAIAAELSTLGVDYYQGFGVHRPAPLDAIGWAATTSATQHRRALTRRHQRPAAPRS